MKSIIKLWDRFFPPVHPLPAGVYPYQSQTASGSPFRLHLRLEPEGHGVLIINARTVLHLNQTAAEYAYHLIHQTPEEQLARIIAKRYQVSKKTAQKDFKDLVERIQSLANTIDLDPVTYLDMERAEPYSDIGTAPYRLDCALTYKTAGDYLPHAAPVERVKRELLSEEWKTILKKAWEAGIPHIVFTGGEPTLRPDLAELIAYAEGLGQVTGLITSGERISETGYLHKLLESGLDHMVLVIRPEEDQAWEALRDSLAEDIAITVHLTVTHHNQSDCQTILQRLARMGVKSISLSASRLDLQDALNFAREEVAVNGMQLVWDMPVPYSDLHPVALELAEVDQPYRRGAGQAWLYLEPDGDVLPGQGIQNVLGNLLTDSFEVIWKNRQPG
ncbi:MAG TPA: radical SAM protein [Anaerolineaceae bacterium]